MKLEELLSRQMTRKQFLGLGVVAVASLFGVAGVLRQLQSKAATGFLSVEPEAGTATAPAAVATDTAASGGKVIKFQPTTTTMTRPTGTGYYAIEDLNVGMDLQKALDKLRQGSGFARVAVPDGKGQPCLTLPEGVFEKAGFTRGNGDPNTAQSNANYTFFSEGVGIIGSGSGTIIRTIANTMSEAEASRIPPKGSPVTQLNPFHTLILNHPKTTSGQFRVDATTQRGKYYGGLRGQFGTSSVFTDIEVNGFPGYLNSPPGETYNFALHACNGMKMYRCKADGRFPGTGVRESAIGFGITQCTNTEYWDCVSNNMGYSHGVVWWHCDGVITHNWESQNNGATDNRAAQYGTAGAGLNHETVTNTNHINPRLGGNTLTDVRYYSNSGSNTAPHRLEKVTITDGTDFNILIEKNQTYPNNGWLTLVNCPSPKYSNNQTAP